MTNSAILNTFNSLRNTSYQNLNQRETVIAAFTQSIESARDIMWQQLDPVCVKNTTPAPAKDESADKVKKLTAKYKALETKYKLLKE
jgi:hypothetical protein